MGMNKREGNKNKNCVQVWRIGLSLFIYNIIEIIFYDCVCDDGRWTQTEWGLINFEIIS